MKLIHTADWHLGQTFFEHDRREEHALFLQWLRKQIAVHGVDLLLISGDVFDNPNPSAESQRVYYHFLRDVTAENPNLQIIVIAGNHDSAARLEAPNPLLETMNVTVRGVVRRKNHCEQSSEDDDRNRAQKEPYIGTGRQDALVGDIDYRHLIIPIDRGGYCLAVPYLRQGDYPQSETYTQGVQAMYQRLYNMIETQSQPIIAMGHLQATGSELSQDDRAERTIIGGLECISPNAFAQGIAYTALGHLHRAQRVSGRERVRYAGAPLPMSFAERHNKQGVNLVTINHETTVERIAFDPPVKLLSIPREPMPLREVLAEIEKLPNIERLPNGEISFGSPYLEVKVLITEPEPSLRAQVERALEGKAVKLARIAASTVQREEQARHFTYEELQKIDPLDMATDIFKRRYGGEAMPEAMKELLQTVIREVERD
jgi:exonuclease SbcD